MTRFLLGSALAATLALTACDTATVESPAVPEITLPEGVSFVERVEREGDEIVIPYSEYVLDNGLKVILHEDDSDPIAHVDVTYHVGSAREEPGRSGFAHFFEHMQFQGSENVGDDQHFKIVSESGGTLNGTTNRDRTNYFQTVPSNQLERMIWLEADRMGYFLDAVTEEKFENQRETVKNERGQNYDNRPYGLIGEKVAEAMYPEGHPYSWLTIGYIEDLDRATLNDLKKFFLDYYGPNNATLTIGGDIDPEQTLEWVNKYFGSIPRGPEVADPDPQLVSLEEDRYVSYEDNIQQPLIYMSFPTVHARHPDEAPLDVLANVLGQGKTSILYANLEKTGDAVGVGTNHPCGELACTFDIYALPNPASGLTLAELEAAMRESIAEVEERGINDDDLARVKASIRSGNIYGLETVSGKVRQLAANETFEDDANLIGAELARYDAVTAEDVMRVYRKYIQGQGAVVLSVLPRGSDIAPARPDTFTMYERDIPEVEDVSDLEWSPPEDDFDRSVMPAPGENPSLSAPEIYEATLSNGIPVIGTVNDEVPTTQLYITIDAGQNYESLDELGLASLTASMLNETSTTMTPEERSNRLAKLGSSVGTFSGDRESGVSVRSLTENLDETIAIAMDTLRNPAFEQADFDRLKAQTIEGIKSAKKNPQSIAGEIYNRRLYGDDTPWAYSNSGTVESVESLTLDDVRRFYEDHYSPAIARVAVVSSLGEDEVMAALAPLADWQGGDVEEAPEYEFPELEEGTIYFVDVPNAPQSQIRIGKRSLPYDATGEYYRAGLMNYTLGGAFNSRINLNLREDKGYTYGARAGFRGGKTSGSYTAGAGVRTDSTLDSIRQFFAEIDAYRENGITDEDIAFTKSSIGQSEARQFESPGQKIGLIDRMQDYDLDPDYLEERKAILADLTRDDAQVMARELLDTDEMIIVVVGDKEAVIEDLKTLDRPIVELDVDGNVVAREG